MKKVFILLELLVIALLLCAFFAFSQADELVVEEQVIKSWGYKTTERRTYSPDYCDPGLSKPARTFYQGIKALKPVKGRESEIYYFRFTLIKEIYKHEEDAVRRFGVIKKWPPGDIKYSKLCLLRKGFRVKNCIYMVHTDASMFYERELPKILGRLKNYIKSQKI
jgi:hypothetical protein